MSALAHLILLQPLHQPPVVVRKQRSVGARRLVELARLSFGCAEPFEKVLERHVERLEPAEMLLNCSLAALQPIGERKVAGRVVKRGDASNRVRQHCAAVRLDTGS